MRTVERRNGIWRLSLEQIEATVADHLGSGRVAGNQAGPCLSRQVSMYLARNVMGWSTSKIGRFYNGRHHTTVLHAIDKVERLRQTDGSFDALVEVLTSALSPQMEGSFTQRFEARLDYRIGGGCSGAGTEGTSANSQCRHFGRGSE
jgi:chromosomal replication initiation ATPase DnaA